MGTENNRRPEKQGVTDRLVSLLVRRKLLVIILILAGTIAVSVGAVRMKTEVILADLFPQQHPYLQLMGKFSEVFGSGGSGVAIAVKVKQGDIFNEKTLGKIKEITDDIVVWDEVYRVLTMSMATYSTKVVKTVAKGEIRIEPLMYPEVPKTPEGIAELKKNVFSNPAYSGMLVSNDGTAAIILTEMKENIPYESMFIKLRGVVTKYSDANNSIHIVGFPILMGWIYSYKTQIYMVMGISILMMIAILFLSFRNFVGMIAPMVIALICTGLGLGFIGWTGINFSPLLYVLAFLVGARMISNAVQITHRYIEEFLHSGGDKYAATFHTMRAMWMPNVMATITEVAGFLVLGIAKIVLMHQLAIIMSFWMATIALEGLLVPIICSYLPLNREKLKVHMEGRSLIAHATSAAARFSIGRGRYVVAGVILVIAVIGFWQASHVKVGDATPGSPILWEYDTYNKDQALINEKFNASSENLVLYYEGAAESVYEPAVLATFEKFSDYMAETVPDIYKTSSSIIEMGKALNLTLHDGDQAWYQLPRTDEQMTGILGYIRNTVGTANLRRFIDNQTERAQITLFFSDHTSNNVLRIKKAAYGFFNDHPMKTKSGEFKLAGGRIGMEIALNEEMKESHMRMDAIVLGAIFIMCILAFRSVVAGIMLTAPLLIANLVAFWYMSWMNIGLSVNTLPVSAVGVGVGVDFAIYLYSRCIEEFPHRKDLDETVMVAAKTTGEAIVYTGLTIIIPVLAWYFISGLKFQAEMGFFLAMIMTTNMVAALTLHPLLLLMVKPKFITKKEGINQTIREGGAAQLEGAPR
jgi:predicted RND superfamily exporter protein